MHCARTPLVRSCKLSFVRSYRFSLFDFYLPPGSPTMTQSTVHLQTRKDAFGSLSSTFAFSFAVLDTSRNVTVKGKSQQEEFLIKIYYP